MGTLDPFPPTPSAVPAAPGDSLEQPSYQHYLCLVFLPNDSSFAIPGVGHANGSTIYRL